MASYVEYDSNNSGGDWWLTDEDWKNLETAGWKVEWRDDRWLGAKATSAKRYGLDYHAAISEWQQVTGQYANEIGCRCCGKPHSFYQEEDRDGQA